MESFNSLFLWCFCLFKVACRLCVCVSFRFRRLGALRAWGSVIISPSLFSALGGILALEEARCSLSIQEHGVACPRVPPEYSGAWRSLP